MGCARILLLVSIASVSGVSMASNTVFFQGEVATQTCTVTVNGSASPLVLLPDVVATSLFVAGSRAGATPFAVEVKNCQDRYNVYVRLVGNNVDNMGRINNTGTAANVKLEIANTSEGKPYLGVHSTPLLRIVVNPDYSGERVFYVRYYSEGVATSGTVSGSLQYAISYL